MNNDVVLNLLKGGKYSIEKIEYLSKVDKKIISEIKLNNLNIINEDPVIYTANIKHESMVDGVGIRNVLFCSLCYHNCFNCQNKHINSIKSGLPRSISDLYTELINGYCDITFSGGEVFHQVENFIELAKMIKSNTNKNIWVYTGFEFEDLIKEDINLEFFKYVDVLVDGKFDNSKRDVTLAYKGSSNQRIINVQESLKQNKIILDIE